jgi:hypothetical protein
MAKIFSAIEEDQKEESKRLTSEYLDPLIQTDRYVGDVVSLSYEKAIVQVHDHFRQRVGGLPSQCFLAATRKRPESAEPSKEEVQKLDWTDEDAAVILLRILGPATLPQDAESIKLRVEAARRATEEGKFWDQEQIDPYTRKELAFSGLECRVLGTFYVDKVDDGHLVLRFGSDISNYYAAYALKVYKPTEKALEIIANYRDPHRLADHALKNEKVEIGVVRYASSNRKGQGVDIVRVSLAPTDLLRQKTALFGMTRTGKSNTTKIIAKAVFELRYKDKDAKQGRVGQLIFDYGGEYANVNVQDQGALKNISKLHPDGKGKAEDVVTYGTEPHPNDPGRRLMKINFYTEEMLAVGKSFIGKELDRDRETRYIEAFLNASVEAPQEGADQAVITRYKRRALAYRALLARANFEIPAGFSRPYGTKLFNRELIDSMHKSTSEKAQDLKKAAEVLESVNSGQNVSWDQLASALAELYSFIEGDPAYKAFNAKYMQESSSGLSWADQDLRGILGMLAQPNGPTLIRRVISRHTATIDKDYADLILEDLHAGRLVIVDQSLGDEGLNRITADRVMERVFREHQRIFSHGKAPPDILVYVEEAHNLLPSGKEFDPEDPRSLWARVAKEGAKLHIGLVYATQEVSSIHKSVLKNTANWFIGHLNNTDETRELVKFYDFEDFEPSILRAQDPGFVRVKTLSNPYVVPVQIDHFSVEGMKADAIRE